MEVTKETLNDLLKETDEQVRTIQLIANDIVKAKTEDLDALMTEIQERIVIQDNPSDELLERYFLELTNALYFLNANCEFFGFYDDMSKTSARMKYNEAYSESQAKAAVDTSSKKARTTVGDHVAYAEKASLNETIINQIYSRSFRIVKSKIEAAQEMVRTLSKLISSHAQDKQLSMFGGVNQNKSGFNGNGQ